MSKEKNPKGEDTREVPPPEGYEGLKEQGIKTIKYEQNIYLEGGSYNTEIIKEIREKINNEESVVICFTGPPGKGKTYFGKRFAQSLDPKFHITDTPPPPQSEDHGQVVFGREHLSYLTGPNTPLKRGQVILLDESHFGVGARSWQNKDQQALVNYLASIRVKGFVLFLIVLHTRMIDALLRDFVVNYEFHVTDRGVARCYRRFFPQFGKDVYKKYLGTLELPLPDAEYCNWRSCLKCKSLRADEDTRCETIRAIYERRKELFLTETGKKRDIESLNKLTKEQRARQVYAPLFEPYVNTVKIGRENKMNRTGLATKYNLKVDEGIIPEPYIDRQDARVMASYYEDQGIWAPNNQK